MIAGEVFIRMKKQEEVILLYHFLDTTKLQQIKDICKQLKIQTKDIGDEMLGQKVGHLVGRKGFAAIKTELEEIIFPHEVIVFSNSDRKRLDQVLTAFKEAKIDPIKFKAIVTPFNMFWSLQRLCETMQKEHGAMIKKNTELE